MPHAVVLYQMAQREFGVIYQCSTEIDREAMLTCRDMSGVLIALITDMCTPTLHNMITDGKKKGESKCGFFQERAYSMTQRIVQAKPL